MVHCTHTRILSKAALIPAVLLKGHGLNVSASYIRTQTGIESHRRARQIDPPPPKVPRPAIYNGFIRTAEGIFRY